MSDEEFRAFLDLMMCSDPWPVDPGGIENQSIMLALAEKEAKKRKFENWIVAFYEFGKKGRYKIES